MLYIILYIYIYVYIQSSIGQQYESLQIALGVLICAYTKNTIISLVVDYKLLIALLALCTKDHAKALRFSLLLSIHAYMSTRAAIQSYTHHQSTLITGPSRLFKDKRTMLKVPYYNNK